MKKCKISVMQGSKLRVSVTCKDVQICLTIYYGRECACVAEI